MSESNIKDEPILSQNDAIVDVSHGFDVEWVRNMTDHRSRGRIASTPLLGTVS